MTTPTKTFGNGRDGQCDAEDEDIEQGADITDILDQDES